MTFRPGDRVRVNAWQMQGLARYVQAVTASGYLILSRSLWLDGPSQGSCLPEHVTMIEPFED